MRDALQVEYGIRTLPVIMCGKHGKPYFEEYAEIHFNYSHTKHMVACGLCTHEIGVDIEELRPVKDSLMKKVCHPEEYEWVISQKNPNEAMIRLWTIKEAYVKKLGCGITTDLALLNFTEILKQGGSGLYKDCRITTIRIGVSWLAVCHPSDITVMFRSL